MLVSVICPIYNEEKYISKCIESIMQQDFQKDFLEVLFVDGMSTDKTREIISEYISRCPYIRVLDNPQKIVPYAMNKGILESKGDIIIRIDAHTLYEKNYISSLVYYLQKLKADNVGAVCRTDVLNKNKKTLAIREVLSNRLGVGNSLFRTGVKDIMAVDTVPFGCWRRDVFQKYGLYDVRLVRNQDIELNKRILRGGGKIYLIPTTFCTYLARENFSALAKNNYSNGLWNVLTVYYTKQFSSLSIRHFIPLLFLLSLIVPIVLSIFYLPFIYISLFSLLLYIFVVGFSSMKISYVKKISFSYLITTFTILHLSYGFGSLVGILRLFIPNK